MARQRLLIKHGATLEECCDNLTRQFISPNLQIQQRRSFSAALAAGAIEVAWRRGTQAGTHDAYLTLREAHPEAAQALLDAWNMDAAGTITRGE